jgi:exosortase A-associated hydrolase 2
VLIVPPFAEEMMKARQQFTQFAIAMASESVTTSVIDVRGTGDAEGELADANWAHWRDDVALAFQTLESIGPVTVIGLRLGALLALDACAAHALKPASMMLWEPQLNGKTAIKQFLRIAAVAAKVQGREETAATNTSGQEVGGYWISSVLERDIAGTTAPATLPSRSALVVRLAQEPTPSIPPAWDAPIGAWRAAGSSIETAAIQSPAFWTTPEITVNPSLIEISKAWWHTHVRSAP